jgi:hypothetical protein
MHNSIIAMGNVMADLDKVGTTVCSTGTLNQRMAILEVSAPDRFKSGVATSGSLLTGLGSDRHLALLRRNNSHAVCKIPGSPRMPRDGRIGDRSQLRP